MNIVLEGPDGGGKSTLAEKISAVTGLRVQQGSGPPRGVGEIEARMTAYLALDGVVFDRHPAVSQSVYGAMRGEGFSEEFVRLRDQFYDSGPLMVYCRSTTASRHVVKPGESEDHVRLLTLRYSHLVEAYDAWALKHAQLLYRIGDSVDCLVELISTVTARPLAVV